MRTRRPMAASLAYQSDKPLAGLVDLVLVVDNVLLVVIALAIYVKLRQISPSVTAMATALWLLAIGMFIASNPAVQMLKLSHRFAAAATDEQRSHAIAARQGQPAVPAAYGDRPGSGTSPWRAQDGCSRMPVRPWPSRSLLVVPTPLSHVSNSRFSLP